MYKDILCEKFESINEIFTDNENFFSHNVVYKKFNDKDLIVNSNNQCEGLPLIIKGQIRLFHISENGREMKVFNVREGESCILAAVCMLSDIEFDFLGQAEGETIIAVLSPVFFHRSMEQSKVFRNFILIQISSKLINTVNLLYDINFSSIESRILSFFKANIQAGDEIKITHENLAIELGSSREVISRQLKNMEKNGVIALSRGIIKVITDTKTSI